MVRKRWLYDLCKAMYRGGIQSDFSHIMANKWRLSLRVCGAFTSFVSVGKADARFQSVRIGRYLKSFHLNVVVPIELVTWILYTYVCEHTKMSQSSWCSTA